LFQFAGFFLQAQFRQALDPVYPLAHFVVFQVVVNQAVGFEQLAAQVLLIARDESLCTSSLPSSTLICSLPT
jgi:hypothetical protein